ncbi:ATP-dependent protease LonB [Natranaerofaba carboxydovora]|uniref:ATP-dependent protease LonB n=1 Tax=Natranaerofaba carboxydovora TaxID=2742683 RepID=UPI001F143946|nr:ATP-dependent protease LonB [Natranaerofaba carboxydovora]UMZ72833.1 Lon protease 2 [Natranaerofaba carboxydovora]
MTGLWTVLGLVQFFFAVVIGLYFWNQLKSQKNNKTTIEKESKKQMDKLRKLKQISLTKPLSEKTRPTEFSEIVGQEEGLKSLRAALCGSNPQHVLVYGPPGTGKTAAARLILEEAKKNLESPFKENAKFIELDATTARFDERGIADPLLGSVHDPIYQGAGAMGVAGIPQPKPGAVTKAHGGILFLDEIGELHPLQMNRLLKVLEDRKVFLESAYYSSEDPKCPSHIHEIFQQGYPADFRLIGATTKSPSEIPSAIRSRCIEIFFKDLSPDNIKTICENTCQKVGYNIEKEALNYVALYAGNGREAVNIIQIAAGLTREEGRNKILVKDVEWVINTSQIVAKRSEYLEESYKIGVANALAVYGSNSGKLLEIESLSFKSESKEGKINIMGAVEEEEMGDSRRVIKRKSMAKSSVENVLSFLRRHLDIVPSDYDIYLNFPGGIPVDGPSAGVAIAVSVYSAVTNKPVDNKTAMTGEVSLRGAIKPVGGVKAKIEAAASGGARRILIPEQNFQRIFEEYDQIEIVPVSRVEEVFDIIFEPQNESEITPAMG